MSNSTSLNSQIKDIVLATHAKALEQVKPYMQEQANTIISIIMSEMDGFHDITGNTRNSVGVGCYLDGKLMGMALSSQKLSNPATRTTLIKGEMYNLEYYWGGDSIVGRPYRGETGSEHYLGRDKAVRFIQSKRPSTKGWSFIAVIAVDYAKYLEAKPSVNVLTIIRDELASSGANISVLMAE